MHEYLIEEDWERFYEWWRSEQFARRFTVVRAARGKVKVPRTFGAHSFERRRRDYVSKHNKKPPILEHFRELHTRRDNGALISEEA